MYLTEHEIKTIKDFFNDRPVVKAYLFGSYARKDAGRESDVNILVELDEADNADNGSAKMEQDLQSKLHKRIDLVSTAEVSKYFLPFIEHDKKLIYKKSPLR
jgi:uncharacterized protein